MTEHATTLPADLAQKVSEKVALLVPDVLAELGELPAEDCDDPEAKDCVLCPSAFDVCGVSQKVWCSDGKPWVVYLMVGRAFNEETVADA